MIKKIALLLTLFSTFVFSDQEFDPEKDVAINNYFEKESIVKGEEFSMIISIDLPDGFHISDNDLFYFDTTEFPEIKTDGENLSGRSVHKGETVYKGTVDFIFEGTYTEKAERSVLVGYQTCSETGDESCYMPVEKTIKIDFSRIDPSKFENFNQDPVNSATEAVIEQDDSDLTMEEKLAGMLEGEASGSFIVFLITFLGGILASLTPCVYPIIPVVVSYMGAKSGSKKSAGFTLSLFFVLGLAITYSIIGLLASFFSEMFGVGDFASNPIVRSVIALIFFILALSMFGFWDMTLLSSDKQTKMMEKGKEKKGVIGALIIGMVSGLVAAPCVGPVLAMLLIHVANAGDVLYGSMLFMTFALGMGMLFLVIGTFSGALSAMPNSGMWMIKVKKVFGIVMTAAAIYFIKIVIPDYAFLFIVSVLLIMLSVFLGGFSKIDTKTAGISEYTGKSLGIFVFIIAIIFSLKTIALFTELPFASGAAYTVNEKSAGVQFEKTDSDTDIVNKAVKQISGTNKLVMVDLWAEWCTNCIELDKKTWSDPEVAGFVKKNFIPIKLDFTKKDSDFSKKFIGEFKEHGATNLPLILFIDHEGNVVDKMLGFIEAERMLGRLKNIVEKNK